MLNGCKITNMNIKRYNPEFCQMWDEFVLAARNSHFFFLRNYMEYHRDRFDDFSLLFFDDHDRLLAVLPASRHEKVLISHGGLTFGGFIFGEKMTAKIMLDVFAACKDYLSCDGFSSLIYKCTPYIYHHYPCDEDKYALFINGATLFRRDVSTAVYLPQRYKYFKGRSWMVNKGRKNNIVVHESKRFQDFISLENEILHKYHDTKAVHTGEELERLAALFPDNIKLYVGQAANSDEILAGTVIFDNGSTVHTQYLANSDEGRQLGALDAVIDHLITKVYADRKYFDFGISNEQEGRYLNEGLISQKEGFGARAVVHDFYRLDLH